MKTMPRLLLLLFCMSVVTMLFIARCGLNIDSQLEEGQNGGMPTTAVQSPGEKALREVMRRKEVEHIRDKSALLEKIKNLESKLAKVQRQVVNLTSNLKPSRSHQKPQPTQPWNPPEDAQRWNPPENAQRWNPPENAQRWNPPDQDQLWNPPQYMPVGKTNHKDPYKNNNMIFIKEAKYTKMIGGNEKLFPYRQNSISGKHQRANNNNARNGGAFPAPDLNGKPAWPDNRIGGQTDSFSNNNFQLGGHKFDNLGLPRDSGAAFVSNEGVKAMDRRALGVTEDMNKMSPVDSVVDSKNALDTSLHRYQRNVPDFQTMDTKQQSDSLETQSHSSRDTAASMNITDFSTYINDRINSAEIVKGMSYKTEYELIPFNRFVYNRIYMVDPGLGKRVVEKPIGTKKRDLSEILEHAISTLNKNRTQYLYTHDDFVEGVYRTDPATGSLYELYFYDKSDQGKKHHHLYTKLSVVRPFAPPMTLQRQTVNTSKELINIILPLSGRFNIFRIFIEQFVNVCIKQDRRVFLTVVYFGTSGMKEVKSIMGKVAKAYKFKHMKLVTLNETFTRGRALQIGALNWKNGDVLQFFCDVDIVFTGEFIERCRLNTQRGHRVYYPIVFSLYNPNIVYSLQDAPIPSLHDQLVLSKDTGFWRDFGYGMTCQYRSDFLKIKGFDEQITGWGGEDVFLYQKFVRSEYFVLRVTDPAIFHLWHEKYCDPNISAEQYRSCIRSKALNEASHAQLGLLAFKDEINIHRNVSERNSLKNGVSWRDNKHVNKGDSRKSKS